MSLSFPHCFLTDEGYGPEEEEGRRKEGEEEREAEGERGGRGIKLRIHMSPYTMALEESVCCTVVPTVLSEQSLACKYTKFAMKTHFITRTHAHTPP